MTGLFLLLVLGIWVAIVVILVRFVARRLRSNVLRVLIGAFLIMVLLPLPVADEIIWGRQFKRLCSEKSHIEIDSKATWGRTVWFGGGQRERIQLGSIEVHETRVNIVDAKNQEPIYHYYRLEAKGGFLIRSLGISEGDYPLLFRGFCQPADLPVINKNLGLVEINRSIKR